MLFLTQLIDRFVMINETGRLIIKIIIKSQKSQN